MKTIALTLLLGSGLVLNAQQAPPADPAPTLEARCSGAFGDNAVFQQNMPVPIWGQSLPQAKVTVAFDKQSKSTTAGADGAWRVTLDPMPADKLTSVNEAPAGRTLTITTSLKSETATKSYANILIGEVWLCAGQSNIGGKLGRAAAGSTLPDGSILTGNYPALRQTGGPGPWLVCSPETVDQFKKVGFHFGRPVQQEIRIPVGIISAAVGGSSIETWLNQPPQPASNYEKLIAPLVGYGIRGIIWYQGEGNEKDGRTYLPKLLSLIRGWRDVWKQGDFPFYFVQIASIGESPADQPAGGDGRAEIRNAQFEALSVANTGMAVTIDIGEKKEHPKNKYDVGLRLAQWALNKTYGKQDVVPSGPLYKSQVIEGAMIRVKFDYAQHGLMLAKKEGCAAPIPTPDAPMPWLSIQAKDRTWHWAEGRIAGSDLIVSSKDVREPVAVRYAYTQFPAGCNLYNKDGLPAAPFSTCGY